MPTNFWFYLLPTITDDLIEHSVTSAGRSSVKANGEPNLNDVVDFLSSEDPSLVSNAASYLQHLAYGDDNMKAKIRWEFEYIWKYDYVEIQWINCQ